MPEPVPEENGASAAQDVRFTGPPHVVWREGVPGTVEGSGNRGRVTKDDVKAWAKHG